MVESAQKVLFLDARTGYYRVRRYRIGDYFGPVDLGLHISGREMSLNFGVGLFAGSILPGSNRLVFTGFSPCWRGFYISSMGGAGLVFENLGINLVSLVGKAARPSILYLNRLHGEEIEVELLPVELSEAWKGEAEAQSPGGGPGGPLGPAPARRGAYGLLDLALKSFGPRYAAEYRAFAVGPAALATDFGAILSAPVREGRASEVDTWAGRGGLGSKMLQEHGIAAVVYGGTVVDEDFRDRRVADEWFEERYRQKLAVKDFEATTKYRFDPKFQTGGTFGVNYAAMGGRLLAFNYRSLGWTEEERKSLHERLVLGHYLRQFNEESIATKSQATCGEPCAAVCKKLRGDFKKDYEPYQALGPLCGVFDQRAAERLNRASDEAGFDAISLGGLLAWLMDLLDRGSLRPEELGVGLRPRWVDGASQGEFRAEEDSAHNAELGLELVAAILEKRGRLDLSEGPRKWGRRLRREGGQRLLDRLVYTAHGRRGWMVPNQYWTPGVLAPMAIMGKYYMHYGAEFLPPRELGQACAQRLKKELAMDDAGLCRFHRLWGEEMMAEAMGKVFGKKDEYLAAVSVAASRINSRNAAVYWESEADLELVRSFLLRRRDVEGEESPELAAWIAAFEADPKEAALDFWFEMRKGIDESLRDFL